MSSLAQQVFQRDQIADGQCILCLQFNKNGTTEHHLIPRACHKNKWFRKKWTLEQMRETVPICRPCHNMIHDFIPSEKLLGRDYYTLELLQSHPQVANYIAWARRRS